MGYWIIQLRFYAVIVSIYNAMCTVVTNLSLYPDYQMLRKTIRIRAYRLLILDTPRIVTINRTMASGVNVDTNVLSRLKDKALFKSQAVIGGSWVAAKDSETYNVIGRWISLPFPRLFFENI